MTHLQTEIVPLSELKPHPRNYREHPADQLQHLVQSIKEHGVYRNVVIAQDGTLLAGHGVVQAAQKAGISEIPVIRLDVDPNSPAAIKVLVGDNEIGQLADQDSKGLADLLNELKEIDTKALMGTGYTAEMLANLTHATSKGLTDPDDVPEDVPAIAKVGDLWKLGPHRLAVGSCTEGDTVRRLMDGEQASCIFTDPPYGVNYESPSGKHEPIKGDNLEGDNLLRLLAGSLRQAAAYSTAEAAFYIWHAAYTREDFVAAMRAAGLMERQYLIWVKNYIGFGYADYRWTHEPCFYASKDGKQPAFYGASTESSVWRATLKAPGGLETVVGNGVLLSNSEGGNLWIQQKPPKKKRVRTVRLGDGDKVELRPDDRSGTVWEISRDTKINHPTQKPVELATRAIDNSSRAGQIIYDPFLGSGSTLIGAEFTGRRCFGCELEPKYADVIVRRWEGYTGKKAERENI